MTVAAAVPVAEGVEGRAGQRRGTERHADDRDERRHARSRPHGRTS
jgi:hypothetical protein